MVSSKIYGGNAESLRAHLAIPQAKDWLEQAHSDLSQGPADLQPAARCHAFRRKVLTLEGLEPAIFGSEDQRLIH